MPLLKGLLHHDYGSLGRLSPSDWKQRLSSNQGLFRRITAANNAVGPTLNTQGEVVADTLTIEYAHFIKYSTADQQRLYDNLTSLNPSAAKEYLLTMTNTLEQWKNDVRWLKIALKYLKRRERFLSQEAALLQQINQEFPEVIRRHFPQLFSDIKFVGLNVEETLSKIQAVLHENIVPEERYLKNYLMKLQIDMPFLF